MLKGAEFGVYRNICLFKHIIINDLSFWFESRPDRKIAKSLSEMKGFFYGVIFLLVFVLKHKVQILL